MMRGFSMLFVPFRCWSPPLDAGLRREGGVQWSVLPAGVRHLGGAGPCRAAFRAAGHGRLMSSAAGEGECAAAAGGPSSPAVRGRLVGVECSWGCCGEVAAAACFSVFGVSRGAIGDTSSEVLAPAGGAGRAQSKTQVA
jgi:hypothetical protein